jgi:hypothetical protein
MSRKFIWIPALSVAMALSLSGSFTARADDPPAGESHGGRFSTCAKVCADCMNSCASCYRHCAHLVASEKTDHEKSMILCNDCSELCGASAKLTSRQSPLSILACETCAKACDQCADSCGKFPDDKHMADCTAACKECAKACRDMISHLTHEQSK